VLEIDDDSGFDVEAPTGGGMGLGNIGARAESIGGELRIVSHAGEGTTVRITIPL
jgi:signal transduction histidine kinase